MASKRSTMQTVRALSGSPGSRPRRLSADQKALEAIAEQKLKDRGVELPVREVADGEALGGDRVVESADEPEPEDSEATEAETAEDESSQEPEPAQESKPASDQLAQVTKMMAQLQERQQAQEKQYQEQLAKQQEAHQAELRAAEERAEAQLEAVKKELENKTEIASVLEDMNRLLGRTGSAGDKNGGAKKTRAQALEVLGEGSKESRQFMRLYETAPKTRVLSRESSRYYWQRETKDLDRHFRQNREAIRQGLEATLRDKGMFGGDSQVLAESISDGSLPSALFPYLSAVIRDNSWPDLVHHQLVDVHSVPGRAPRQIVEVPRYPFTPGPTAASDRFLTPGVGLSGQTRNVTEELVDLRIRELGLGKDDANAPLGFSEFVAAMSLFNVEAIVERNLGRDYQTFKDVWITETLFTANTVLYNEQRTINDKPVSAVTTDATDIDAGEVGTMTRAFLRALYTWMRSQQIKTYPDGTYCLVLNPTAAGQLTGEVTDQERYIGQDFQTTFANMLSRATQNEGLGGEVDGYLGKIDNFHCIMHNAYGLTGGGAGDPGTADITLGTGITGTREALTSFAMGPNSMAWATAMPVELRMENDGSFDRLERLIWLSHETHGPLDLNFVSGEQERRVVEVRTLTQPV